MVVQVVSKDELASWGVKEEMEGVSRTKGLLQVLKMG
jgi:hypothetical protein